MQQQPPPGYPVPPEPHGTPMPSEPHQVDTVEDTGGALKARWSSLDLPLQIGLVAGSLILVAAFARFVLPAMLAAVGIGALIAVLFIPYWLPTIVAFFRGHPNKLAIALVNFFFGWTFVGWFISLFWALSDPSPAGGGAQSVIVNVSNTATGVAGPAQQAPPAVGAGQLYRVGDVVNGHRFDGVNWVPEPAPQPAPPPAAQQAPPPAPPVN